MGLKKPKTLDPIPDVWELVQAARSPDLRARKLGDLQELVTLLEAACETARVAELRDLLDPKHTLQERGDMAFRCGFAELFAGVRRARMEMKRRAAELSQPADGASGGPRPMLREDEQVKAVKATPKAIA